MENQVTKKYFVRENTDKLLFVTDWKKKNVKIHPTRKIEFDILHMELTY